MTEVETLREAFEERNREFATLEASGIPAHVARLPDYLGQGPGKVLHDMLTRQLEESRASHPERRPTDVQEAAYDAVTLAVRSMHGPLTKAETWQLCYRLAYLVGYGRNASELREAATRAVREANRRRASAAGKNRHKAMSPIRNRFFELLPGVCYGVAGRRLKKHPARPPGAVQAARDALSKRFPEGDLPTEETLGEWLTEWQQGQGFATWSALPSTWIPGQPWPPEKQA